MRRVVDRLEPVVFEDAWGSHVSIASLQGRTIPTVQPESELWMGAHEEGPSGVDRGGYADLASLIAANPERELGPQALAAYGPRLPFLLKVLAPNHAISIQVHPSAERAVEVRRATGSQVYVDDWAKPELLVAVSAFEVFVGMRSIEQVAGTFRGLGVRALVELLDRALQAPDPLHALLAGILHTPDTDRVALVRDVVAACVMAEGRDDPDGELSAAVVRIAEEHPDDIGVVVLLLMNHRVLHPGEFIDVPAGVLHSYVRGLGVEVLANSDNVVRAGLTGKAVNVEELLEIVDTSADGVIGRPVHRGPGIETFETTSDRFCLHRVRADEERILPGAVQGPRIAFCLRGEVSVTAGGERVVLKGTESAFLPADTGVVTARGAGELYVVSAPI